MGEGAKCDQGTQRRSLRLSGAPLKITLSKKKRLGTDTGQVSK
jgi:hypothetical protein